MAITQVSNSLVKQDLTISGGTVDNTVIGSGTPAAGTFTTIAGTLASTVTGTTAAASDNSTKIATTAYVDTATAALVDSAPTTLDTLNELAAALGDDPNFATTVTNSIAAKAPLASPTFTGTVTVPTADINGGTIDGTTIGGSTAAAGSFTTGSFSGNVSFADNAKAIFGTDSDLQIYHDGSDSYISDQGSGNLKLLTDEFRLRNAADSAHMLTGSQGGAITLYHNGSAKLATTSSGIDVTGTVTADGATLALGSVINFSDRGNLTHNASTYDMTFNTNSLANALVIKGTGSVGIGTSSPSHDLDVLSTTSGTSRTIRVASTASSGDNDATMIISNGGSGDAMLRFDYEGTNTDRARIGVSSSAQQLEFYTAGDNERMRIDSSGNVGIGTSGAPSFNTGSGLEIQRAGPATLRIEDTGSGGKPFEIYSDDAEGYVLNGRGSGMPMYFKTVNQLAMTIDTNQNVGIGTSDAKEKLSVSGAAVFDGDHATGTNAYGAAQGVMIHAASSTGFITAVSNGANDVDLQLRALNGGSANSNQLVLDSEGNVGIGGSPTKPLTVFTSAATDSARFTDNTNSELFVKHSAGNLLTLATGSTSQPLAFGQGSSERLRIDSGGKLIHEGLSGTSPIFEMINNDNEDTDTGRETSLRFSGHRSGGEDVVNAQISGHHEGGLDDDKGMLFFYTNGGTGLVERARINSTGRVLGFTSSTKDPGDTPEDTNSYVLGPGYMFLQRDDTASVDQITFGKNGSVAGRITTTSSTTYTTTSDYRRKENITPVVKGLERVQKLNPVSYTWIDDEVNAVEEGFIAHEVQEAGWTTGISGEKDGEDVQSMDYGRITPLLVKAIQEQQTLIESLTDRIAALENN